MISRKLATLFAMGTLTAACSAPPSPQPMSNVGRSEALADGAYSSLIDDPSTGQRDWTSINPEASGIAYWHVGWVSRRGRGGRTVEYVLATGYDNVTTRQSVEVVIPQTENDIAYEFRSLGGAQLDEDRLTADVEAISEALVDVFDSGDKGDVNSKEKGSRCVGGRSTYRRPGDLRRLRRCRIGGRGMDDELGGRRVDDFGNEGVEDEDGSGPRRQVDPLVVFLNIAVGVAEDLSDQSRCQRSLDEDYRRSRSDGDEWDSDCHNRGRAWRPRRDSSSTSRGDSDEIIGSCDGVVGDVCFDSEGVRGRCGADGKCRRL